MCIKVSSVKNAVGRVRLLINFNHVHCIHWMLSLYFPTQSSIQNLTLNKYIKQSRRVEHIPDANIILHYYCPPVQLWRLRRWQMYQHQVQFRQILAALATSHRPENSAKLHSPRNHCVDLWMSSKTKKGEKETARKQTIKIKCLI